MPMIKCTDEQAYLMELCLETMCREPLHYSKEPLIEVISLQNEVKKRREKKWRKNLKKVV